MLCLALSFSGGDLTKVHCGQDPDTIMRAGLWRQSYFVTAVKSIVCHISSGPSPKSERITMDMRRYQGSPKRADLPNNRLQPNFVTSGYPWLKPKARGE